MVDRLTDVAPVTVERTVYVAERWLPSSFLCPGCGGNTLWFPLEARNPHVCIACGGAYSVRGLAATDDHKTVVARIRQVTGWAGAGEAEVHQRPDSNDEVNSPR